MIHREDKWKPVGEGYVIRPGEPYREEYYSERSGWNSAEFVNDARPLEIMNSNSADCMVFVDSTWDPEETTPNDVVGLSATFSDFQAYEQMIRDDERKRLANEAFARGDIGRYKNGPEVWNWLMSESARTAKPRDHYAEGGFPE